MFRPFNTLFRCWVLVTFYTCLLLSLFLWNSLSAPLHSHTGVTLPKHRQGCLTPSHPPAPSPLFPLKITMTPLLAQFTHHKTAFQPHFLFCHHIKYRFVQHGGSYLCRCIPQTGSSWPLSFHVNNVCSNGSQARAIWESQTPLRGCCTNTSIVLQLKSLLLVVTPCLTQPRQHRSALTQLDINSRLQSSTPKDGRNSLNRCTFKEYRLSAEKDHLSWALYSAVWLLHNTAEHNGFHICTQTDN